MKDHNLLKQKLALIASSGVLADTVVSALDDACNLLDEYKAEIDKLQRHNASLISNEIQAALSKGEIVSNTLKNARLKIEDALNNSVIRRRYGDESIDYMRYCQGIRDACWAIDKMIKEQAG